MSINWFEFAGVRSDSKGLLISKKKIYGAPQRDFELVHVPGRDGDVLIDRGGWKNVDVSYTVQFDGLPEKVPELHRWLTVTGYGVLCDSYQPGYFRLGAYTSLMNPDEIIHNVGQLEVVFSCKPYLYRDDGEESTFMTVSGSTITNPEMYESLPLIEIIGNGNIELYIANRLYSLRDVDGYIDIDSESMCAYKDDVLCNEKLRFTEFPTLVRGQQSVQWVGDVSRVEIVPRWRKL